MNVLDIKSDHEYNSRLTRVRLSSGFNGIPCYPNLIAFREKYTSLEDKKDEKNSDDRSEITLAFITSVYLQLAKDAVGRRPSDTAEYTRELWTSPVSPLSLRGRARVGLPASPTTRIDAASPALDSDVSMGPRAVASCHSLRSRFSGHVQTMSSPPLSPARSMRERVRPMDLLRESVREDENVSAATPPPPLMPLCPWPSTAAPPLLPIQTCTRNIRDQALRHHRLHHLPHRHFRVEEARPL